MPNNKHASLLAHVAKVRPKSASNLFCASFRQRCHSVPLVRRPSEPQLMLQSYRSFCTVRQRLKPPVTKIFEIDKIIHAHQLIQREFSLEYYISNIINCSRAAPRADSEVYSLHQDAIAVIDIDDTIYEPVADQQFIRVGSDAWFEDEYRKKMKYFKHDPKYSSVSEAELQEIVVNNILPEYTRHQQTVSMQLVEGAHTSEVFYRLQNMVPCLFVTAKNSVLLDDTQRHFQQLNFSLHSRYSNFTGEIEFLEKNTVIKIKNGVVHCNGVNKGLVLQKVLTKLDCAPKKILVVDDKLKNIEAIKEVFNPKGVDIIGIHYTHVKKRDEMLKSNISKCSPMYTKN